MTLAVTVLAEPVPFTTQQATSAVLTPTPGALLVVAVTETGSAAATGSGTLDSTLTGMGATAWTSFRVSPSTAAKEGGSLSYCLVPAGAGSGTITVSLSAIPNEGRWTIFQVTGVDPVTPVVGGVQNDGLDTTGTVSLTLPQAPTVDDMTVMLSGSRNGWHTQPFQPGPGFVKLRDSYGTANPESSLFVETRTGSTSTTASVSGMYSASNMGVAFVVKAATGGGTTTTTTAQLPVTVSPTPKAATVGAAALALAALISPTVAAATVGATQATAGVSVGLQVTARTEAATAAPAPVQVSLTPQAATVGQAATQAPVTVGLDVTATTELEPTTGAATLPVTVDLDPAASTTGTTTAPAPVVVDATPQARTVGQAQAPVPTTVDLVVAARTVVVGQGEAVLPVVVGLTPAGSTVGSATVPAPVTVQLVPAAGTVGRSPTTLPATVGLVVAARTVEQGTPAEADALPVTVGLQVTAHTVSTAAVALPVTVGLNPAAPYTPPPTTPTPASLTQGRALAATLTGAPHAGTLGGTAHTPTISEGTTVVEFNQADRKPILWDAVVAGADPTGATAAVTVAGTEHPMDVLTLTRTPGGWAVRAITRDMFAGPGAPQGNATPLTAGDQPALFALTLPNGVILTDLDTITVT